MNPLEDAFDVIQLLVDAQTVLLEKTQFSGVFGVVLGCIKVQRRHVEVVREVVPGVRGRCVVRLCLHDLVSLLLLQQVRFAKLSPGFGFPVVGQAADASEDIYRDLKRANRLRRFPVFSRKQHAIKEPVCLATSNREKQNCLCGRRPNQLPKEFIVLAAQIYCAFPSSAARGCLVSRPALHNS